MGSKRTLRKWTQTRIPGLTFFLKSTIHSLWITSKFSQGFFILFWHLKKFSWQFEQIVIQMRWEIIFVLFQHTNQPMSFNILNRIDFHDPYVVWLIRYDSYLSSFECTIDKTLEIFNIFHGKTTKCKIVCDIRLMQNNIQIERSIINLIITSKALITSHKILSWFWKIKVYKEEPVRGPSQDESARPTDPWLNGSPKTSMHQSHSD